MDGIQRAMNMCVVRKWIENSRNDPFPVSFDMVCKWFDFTDGKQPKSIWYENAVASLKKHNINMQHMAVDKQQFIELMSINALYEWAYALNTQVSQDVVNIIQESLRDAQYPTQPQQQQPPQLFPEEMVQHMYTVALNFVAAEDRRRGMVFEMEQRRAQEKHALEMKKMEYEATYWKYMCLKNGLLGVNDKKTTKESQ